MKAEKTKSIANPFLKTLIIAFTGFIILGAGSAVEITPAQNTYDIEPGTFKSVKVDVDSANGTVKVDNTQAPSSISINPDFFDNEFQQGDQIPFKIISNQDLSPGNYTVNVTVEDTYTVNQGNNSSQQKSRLGDTTLNLRYEQPYINIFERSVDQGQTLKFTDNDLTLTIDDITSDNVTFSSSQSISCLELSNKCSFTYQEEDYRITILDKFPDRDFTRLKIEAINDQNVRIQENVGGGKILVEKSFPSEPITRGSSFDFQTVDNKSGERIGSVKTRFRGQDYGTLGRPSTDEFGYGAVEIPEDFNENKIRYQILAVTSDKDYELGSGIFTLPSSYQDYLKSNNLTFKNLDSEADLENKFTGKITTVNGKVTDDTEVIVKLPNGEIQRQVQDNGDFKVSLPDDTSSGVNMTVQGVRTSKSSSQFNTEKITIPVRNDKDGDGILDHNEAEGCVDVEGEEANNGCPVIEVEGQLYSYTEEDDEFKAQDQPETFNPETSYLFQVTYDDNDTVAPVNGELKVFNESGKLADEISVTNGMTTLGFKEIGDYTLRFNKNKTEEIDEDYEVEKSGLDVPVQPLAAVLVTLGLLGVVYLFRDKIFGGSGRNNDYAKGSMSPQNGPQPPGNERGR